MRVQRQPTGPDRQGSRVSRVPPAKRPQPTGAGLGLTHRETQTFPVPRQVWSRAPRPPIAQGTARNGRARRHQPGALRHDAHQAKDKMEQSVTEGGSQSRSHARARSRQAGSLPSRLRPVATPPVPTADPRPGTPTAGSWNSNYPGCSAQCSLRQQVRLVRAYAKQSATYVDVHMDDGVS